MHSIEELETFAARVRRACSAGSVVALESEQLAEAAHDGGFADIGFIRDSGRVYAYSDLHMTRRYAESAARAMSPDLLHAIAETVRSDSAVYPRPTPVAVFLEQPFLIAPERLNPAIAALAADPAFADIRQATASDGSVFLFSTNHMDAAQARSLAEWLAVTRFNNP